MHIVDSTNKFYALMETYATNTVQLRRYLKYLKLCAIANKNSLTYSEKHHILPKSIFPQFKHLGKHPWNRIDLTYKQHFYAHVILAKAIDTHGFHTAVMRMHKGSQDGQTILEKSVIVVKAKERASIKHKQYLKESHPFRGKTHSQESKAKMSKARLANSDKLVKIYFLDIMTKCRISQLQMYIDQG